MTPAFYRRKWEALKKNPDKRALDRLAGEIARSFLDRQDGNDHHEPAYIHLLCEMATSFDDRDAMNQAGSSALFGIIVEGLCDDFGEAQTVEYNRVMSWMVDFCRRVPGGERLDRELRSFGLVTCADLFTRIEGIRSCTGQRIRLKPPRRILLLSRVTIGADVAVTSVLVQRLGRLFPEAEIVLLGGGRLAEICGGHPRIRVREIAYSRRGSLVERFNSWFAVRAAIAAESAGLAAEEVVVIDPDSRLSQLGILPVTDKGPYLFFNSRASGAHCDKLSIAELANHWMDRMLGPGEFCHPRVWLEEAVLAAARKIAADLRTGGCRRLVVVNFGVGGNARKRLGATFEEGLLCRLLEEPGTVVLLDQGFGEEELAGAQALIRALRTKGFATAAAAFGAAGELRLSSGLIAVSAGIGEIAALIAHSDEFIGYDSACQHIAAALGIPTCTLFAGSNNPRFIHRWSPCGPNRSAIIHVDTLTHPPVFEIKEVISRVMDARKL